MGVPLVIPQTMPFIEGVVCFIPTLLSGLPIDSHLPALLFHRRAWRRSFPGDVIARLVRKQKPDWQKRPILCIMRHELF